MNEEMPFVTAEDANFLCIFACLSIVQQSALFMLQKLPEGNEEQKQKLLEDINDIQLLLDAAIAVLPDRLNSVIGMTAGQVIAGFRAGKKELFGNKILH